MTVTGINDTEEDGPKPYVIALERVQSRDRFYDGFNPDDVSVTNQDNDPEPDPLEIGTRSPWKNWVLEIRCLDLVVAFLFSAVRKSLPKEG